MSVLVAVLLGIGAGFLVRLFFPYKKSTSIIIGDIAAAAVGSIVAAAVFGLWETEPGLAADPLIPAAAFLGTAALLIVIFKFMQKFFGAQSRGKPHKDSRQH